MYLITRIRSGMKGCFLYALLRRCCFGGPFIVSSLPSLIRIETIQARKALQRIRAEIFLVDDSVGPNDKRLHTRDPILGRRGSQREAADHYALHDEVHLPKRRSRTLTLEYFKEVAVIRLSLVRVTFGYSFRNVLTDGACPCSIRVLPCKSVVLSRGADYFLGVLVYLRIVMFFLGILVLRLDETTTDLDRIQFIRTDPPH